MKDGELEIVQCGQVEPFGNYRYEVRRLGSLVVEIEHLYNGDEYFMRTPHGQWEATGSSLDGGGLEPLRLSKSGQSDLKRLAVP